MLRRIAAVSIALLIGGLVWSGAASAHAKLLRGTPVPGSKVAAPPKVVRLVFTLSPNEELDVRRSTLSVADTRGRRVDDGKGGVDLNDLERRTMIARLKPIGPGTYTVRWKAVSSPDLDVAQGSYKFTVAAAMGGMTLPALRIISPANGATVRNPVAVVFETPADLSKMAMGGGMSDMRGMQPAAHLHIEVDRRVTMPAMKHLTKAGPQRYRFSLGSLKPGRHTIRVYWADAHHKAVGTVRTVTVTVR
jgi:methionine-rich copper-binding protein CopC